LQINTDVQLKKLKEPLDSNLLSFDYFDTILTDLENFITNSKNVAISMTGDSFLSTPIEKMISNVILLLEKALNDKEGWVYYYVYDLNFGKNPRMVRGGHDGPNILIDSNKKLYNLMKGKMYED